MSDPGKLNTSSSELDLDRPNIEDYLPSGTSIHEPHGQLRLYCYLLLLLLLLLPFKFLRIWFPLPIGSLIVSSSTCLG
ncbi:unnamed protein product [Linum tenue]|uniref:Uncharacterized protein n=1 Tax=Linum tenue TaxID=586396 RepID=A0AAV0PFE6_9ROSI|nr:unnamed protein product [Linum tenue]